MRLPETIKTLLDDVTSEEALRLLGEFGNPNATIFAHGSVWNLRKAVEGPQAGKTPAKEFGPLKFWGGPPNKLRYYDGSLHTMLCDRVMDYLNTRGSRVVYQILTNPVQKHIRIEYNGVCVS
jgi:hypothetical protein